MRDKKPRIFLKPGRMRLGDPEPWADIDAHNVHHLRHVLRLGSGAKIIIFDGSGKEYEAEIVESRPRRMTARITGSSMPDTEPKIQITLAQALIKENNFARVLTSCTELGCARFIPVLTERTVIKTTKKDITGKLERWQKILESSAAQCGRVKVPRITVPIRLADLLGENIDGLKILLSTLGRGVTMTEAMEDAKSLQNVMIIIGPEGGLTEKEEEFVLEKGFIPATLGPRILRAETAGAAAIAVIQHEAEKT